MIKKTDGIPNVWHRAYISYGTSTLSSSSHVDLHGRKAPCYTQVKSKNADMHEDLHGVNRA